MMRQLLLLAGAGNLATCAATGSVMRAASPPAPNGSCSYPTNCPDKVLPRADKQTWLMNASTIIMPCNNTGFTDPQSTKGWSVVVRFIISFCLARSGFGVLDCLPEARGDRCRISTGQTLKAPALHQAGRSTARWTTKRCCSSRSR